MGFFGGALSSNQSVLLISPSSDFVETINFLPRHSSDLLAGDSGSWVVNEKTAEVYGHIIAVDALGEVHVMPIQSILRNIQRHFGALEVGISTEPTRLPSMSHSIATAGRFITTNGMYGLISGPRSGFLTADGPCLMAPPLAISPEAAFISASSASQIVANTYNSYA
ncbi:hypothetical protein EDB81DRAFT_884982 [Dactylonectria macrodidyma]|uniref:Uncharacterized protein n=1 Tax=Dactylonectria macrodidyma TaxID=307937 RepID=A0A9P9J4P3_9HYPO|nr:hypothetical protein EDB81DRAFT_884982 [Dactylonectria macrodidyma]